VRQGRKSSVSRQDLPRGNLTVEGGSDSSNNTTSSDDEEEETYVPSPQGQGKRVVGGSRGVNRATEIEEEEEGEEEVFHVDEIMPLSHVDMGALSFIIPQNPAWMEKVGYKGKTDVVREKRKQNQRLLPRDAYDYKFHTRFQHDFYESVILPKGKRVAISQWIDWSYMKNKHDPIFDNVVAACKAKHLRDVLAFKKNWSNEVIAQFCATLYVEEHGDARNFHWMTEGHWYEVSYA
jgi:hypothetical protein